MNPADLNDLKQLALLAELARPLTHECNNFLNNLLLQLAISEKSFPESSRAEWANLRREGKKLASLFQQWQRHRKQSSDGAKKFEFKQRIQAAIEDFRSDSPNIQILFQSTADPGWMMGCAAEVERLCYLLLGYAIDAQHSGVDSPVIEVQIEASQNRLILRLLYAGPADAKPRWVDFDDIAPSERAALSLSALTCKSLVDRLKGNARLERHSNGRTALVVDFPAADS